MNKVIGLILLITIASTSASFAATPLNQLINGIVGVTYQLVDVDKSEEEIRVLLNELMESGLTAAQLGKEAGLTPDMVVYMIISEHIK